MCAVVCRQVLSHGEGLVTQVAHELVSVCLAVVVQLGFRRELLATQVTTQLVVS